MLRANRRIGSGIPGGTTAPYAAIRMRRTEKM
jgi:hypothetical protein